MSIRGGVGRRGGGRRCGDARRGGVDDARRNPTRRCHRQHTLSSAFASDDDPVRGSSPTHPSAPRDTRPASCAAPLAPAARPSRVASRASRPTPAPPPPPRDLPRGRRHPSPPRLPASAPARPPASRRASSAGSPRAAATSASGAGYPSRRSAHPPGRRPSTTRRRPTRALAPRTHPDRPRPEDQGRAPRSDHRPRGRICT